MNMKKNIQVNPVGLKGYEINERMKELMGIKPINENKSNVVVELTKMGPDGNAYAVIRENHEWYIKKTSKTENIVAEDFKYIGGLMNKKEEAYPSYAKAIKHLNLKFRSLAEAYNYEGEINLFENDNLISEAGVAGFSQMKGNGFSNEGNMEHNTPMFEEGWMEEEGYMSEDVDMSEEEMAIDEMLTREELKGNKGKLDMNKNGELDSDDFKQLRAKKSMNEKSSFPDLTGDGEVTKADILKGRGVDLKGDDEDELPEAPSEEETAKNQVYENKFSIQTALENIDDLIETITEGLKKKV
jgi:hypothetical protein